MMNAAANAVESRIKTEPTTVTTDVNNYKEHPGHGTIKALAWMGKNSVEVIETPAPSIIDDHDVIVKVTGSTICGSDLHLYHGAILEMQKGDILGHEFCGIVDQVGPKSQCHVGDRVVASFQIACGQCQYCKQGLSSMCDLTNRSALQNALYGHRTAGVFGYSHLTGGFAGGQAEQVRVPYGDVNLLKIPDGVPDEKALYLSDVLSTSFHCVEDTGVKEGDAVGIWGAGPIGFFVAQWCILKGARKVILIDNNWRLAWAKERLPTVETLDYSKVKSVPEELKTRVSGGLDVALECAAGEFTKGYLAAFEIAVGLQTDTCEIINEMILAVRKFGRIGVTGVYAGFTNHFNIGSVMEKAVRLIGNGQAPVQKYWKQILEDIEQGKIDPLLMVSHRVDITDMAKLYKEFDARSAELGMMKVYVQTQYSSPPCEGSPALTAL